MSGELVIFKMAVGMSVCLSRKEDSNPFAKIVLTRQETLSVSFQGVI